MVVRRLGLIGAWLAATALAVLLANTSIQLVGGSVTDSPSLRVTALSAEEQPSTSVTSVSPVSVVVAGEESVPPGTAPNPSPTQGSTPTSTVATTPDQTAAPVAPASSTTVVVPPPTGPFLFPTSGGTVTVRCLGEDAVLRGAVPNSGYSVEIRPEGAAEGQVDVQFSSETAEVRVRIACEAASAELVDLSDGGDN